MENTNRMMKKICSERIIPLIEDVHYARYRRRGAKVVFDRYARAVGKPVIDERHPEHAAMTRRAVDDLGKMILHQRTLETELHKKQIKAETRLERMLSSTGKKVKLLIPGSNVRMMKANAELTKQALVAHQAGIYQMMDAQDYLMKYIRPKAD